jgi:hypothetical protein
VRGANSRKKDGKRVLKNSRSFQRLRLKNQASADLPPVEQIPVLIPQKALDAIKAEGAYEFVEAIEVPTEGAGGVYTADYFRSLLDYLKQYPIPGSKDGHETPGNDFYTIGGDVQMRSEDEGTCYFRILVPPVGWNSPNTALISSLQAGIPELSIIAEAEPVRGNDGKVYFTKELGRPRNDIVPEGAMDVTIGNAAAGGGLDEKAIMALIEQGAIDTESEGKDLTVNGKVCRKAALRLQFNGPDKTLGARVMNAIARKLKGVHVQNTKEKNGMTLEEIIAWLKNAIANNQLTVEDLVKQLGMENKLRNATDEQRAKLQAAIAEALELPPETPVEELLKAADAAFKEAEQAAESVVEAEANRLAETRKLKNADGSETDNPVYLYAKNSLKGKRGKQLNEAVEALKQDPVMLSLRSKQADTRTSITLPGFNPPRNQNVREV